MALTKPLQIQRLVKSITELIVKRPKVIKKYNWSYAQLYFLAVDLAQSIKSSCRF